MSTYFKYTYDLERCAIVDKYTEDCFLSSTLSVNDFKSAKAFKERLINIKNDLLDNRTTWISTNAATNLHTRYVCQTDFSIRIDVLITFEENAEIKFNSSAPLIKTKALRIVELAHKTLTQKYPDITPERLDMKDRTTENIGFKSIKDIPKEITGYLREPDPFYVELPNIKNRLILAIENDFPIYIWGEKGTAKTHSVIQLAAECNQPIIRQNLRSDVRTSTFMGRVTGHDGSIFWKDGALPIAMRHGAWLLIDEVDLAPTHILNIFQSVMDSRTLFIEDTLETITAHKNFQLIFTGNTPGTGDRTGQYHGTRPLNAAFRDRIKMWINAKMFDAETLEKLISSHFPALSEAAQIADLILKANASMRGARSTSSLSIRHALSIAQYLSLDCSFDEALEFVLYDQINDASELTAIKTTVDSIGII